MCRAICRHRAKMAVLLLAGLFCFELAAAGSAPLEEVQGLAESGAPGLALRVLDRYQPDAEKDLAAWIEWERQRVAILRQKQAWKILEQRLTELPADLPDEFFTWAAGQRAEALVQLGDGNQARQVLRGLIWSPFEVSPEQLATWRRLVIRSFMSDAAMQDARTAAVRFRQDYGDGEIDDILLRARILLRSDRPAEAVQILTKHTDKPEAGALLLLAQLRAGKRTPGKVLQAALRQMRGKWATEALTRRR